MNEENQTIIKALNMFGRVPEQYELLNEIDRLNNIINTFEEDLENMKMNLRYSGVKYDNDCLIRAEVIQQVLHKLKELKEGVNKC